MFSLSSKPTGWLLGLVLSSSMLCVSMCLCVCTCMFMYSALYMYIYLLCRLRLFGPCVPDKHVAKPPPTGREGTRGAKSRGEGSLMMSSKLHGPTQQHTQLLRVTPKAIFPTKQRQFGSALHSWHFSHSSAVGHNTQTAMIWKNTEKSWILTKLFASPTVAFLLSNFTACFFCKCCNKRICLCPTAVYGLALF